MYLFSALSKKPIITGAVVVIIKEEVSKLERKHQGHKFGGRGA